MKRLMMFSAFLVLTFVIISIDSHVFAQNGAKKDAVESLQTENRNVILDALRSWLNSKSTGPTIPTRTPVSRGEGNQPVNGTPIPTAPLEPLLQGGNGNVSIDIQNQVRKCLVNKNVYQSASQVTGVPWQILAGIHFLEISCDPTKSLVSGRGIGQHEPDVGTNCSTMNTGLGKPKPVPGGCGFDNLLDTAVYAGNHLKGKIGGLPTNQQELVKALAGYNGWGNTNCGKTPFPYCPPVYPGWDHIYPMSKFPDGRHDTMYVVYCADRTPCITPRVYNRIGVLTVAAVIDKL